MSIDCIITWKATLISIDETPNNAAESFQKIEITHKKNQNLSKNY